MKKKMTTPERLQFAMASPIGKLFLIASDKGLCEIAWDKAPDAITVTTLQASTPAAKFLTQTQKELTEYFAGKRKKFTVPLDVQGTDFQKKVWNQLSQIPFGKTQSYKDVAGKIKNPQAMRAVGTANGHNPVSIIVPCHRVIAADGTLGGYAGGLNRKKKLLALEGLILTK